MKRRHPCDICGADRPRWQRLCGVCFAALPGHRASIIDAWRSRDRRAHRRAVHDALGWLGGQVARHMAAHDRRHAVSPVECYRMTAARLGERDACEVRP